jgi:FAD/FMN-containing dehydrogenase
MTASAENAAEASAEVVQLDAHRAAPAPRTELTGWGRYPVVQAHTIETDDLPRASAPAVLSRGLGRAYADSALPVAGEARPVVVTPRADRILAWDPETGVLRAEAGFSLATLREVFLPRGWFSPVSPGTRHVTLGGMVAADIHGKNHHVAGCFGRYVRALRMRTGDGKVREVSAEAHPDLFWATQGGMGLTGHILEVELALERLPSPWIYERSSRHGNLEEVIVALREAGKQFPMTVAWIDTSIGGKAAGRGIVMGGRWAEPGEAPADTPKVKRAIEFPFDLPSGVLNPTTIGWANRFWYRWHGGRTKTHVVHPEKYFWPLDGIGSWNRAFGRRGFTQYQCVLPKAELYREFLEIFRAGGGCSFVTVFKDCGDEGPGPLSFPQPGTTLALDIPLRRDGSTQRLCQSLNDYVVAHAGRVYLAKDAFTTPEHFRRMYPRLPQWQQVVQRYDPQGRIFSAQAQRLRLRDPA